MLTTGRRTTKLHREIDGLRLLDAEWEGPLKCLWCIRSPEDLFVSKDSLTIAQKMARGPFRVCFLWEDRGWMTPPIRFVDGMVADPNGNGNDVGILSMIQMFHKDYLVFKSEKLQEVDDAIRELS